MESKKSKLIHDLRNPLNNISINAELGRLVLERTGDIERTIKIFETILEECRACSARLDGFTFFDDPKKEGEE